MWHFSDLVQLNLPAPATKPPLGDTIPNGGLFHGLCLLTDTLKWHLTCTGVPQLHTNPHQALPKAMIVTMATQYRTLLIRSKSGESE